MSASVASARPRYRIESIPAELKELPRWVVFQIRQSANGKEKKTPFIPGVRQLPGVKCLAEPDNPATWRHFDLALRDAEARLLYLAFAFDRDLPYFFIDADDVVQDGYIRPDIASLGEHLFTYTEWSASRNGLHIIGKGQFPERSANRPVPDGCHPIERYPQHGGRFCIFTGDVLDGFETIEERGDELAAIFPSRAASHPNGSQSRAGSTGPLTDDETEGVIAWASPFWTDGRRHHMALHLSGTLARKGVSRDQAAAIIARCAASDSDPGAKITACHDTYDNLEAGAEISGWYGLKDVCGLTDDELVPLTAILDGFWKRHQPRLSTTERAHGRASASTAIAIPPFPLDALPKSIRLFVRSAATAIGCPPDFVAVPILGLAEGTAGNSRRIVIRRGFEVSPGSWYGVVGESGTGKSPGLKYAMRLVELLEKEAWEEYRVRLEAWAATPKDERDEKPVLEHYMVTDSTGEALWTALASSPGVTLVEDELRRRLKALDAYRKAGDRQAMLALWSNAPVKIIRRTSDPIYVPFPVASLVGGIQPGVLHHLRGEGDDAEADDGWVPRFLLSWQDAEPLGLSDTPFDERTLGPALEVFRSLRLQRSEPHDTRLSDDAYARFKAWHAGNRRVQILTRGLERQWAAKAPFHLARLALVLHLLAWPNDEHRKLSERTMQDAIRILEYFRGHLGRVLPAFGTRAIATIKIRIIRILRTSPHESSSGWVLRSDISNGLRNVSPGDLTAALNELGVAGVVEKRIEPTTTKPGEWWRLVEGHAAATAWEDSDYSDYLECQTSVESEQDRDPREIPNNPNLRNGEPA